jgi:cytochrome c oxidase subunit 2
MVIPAGKVVKFIVTAERRHPQLRVPAFWTKIDANPGQLNETWVKVDRPGVYFGQCSELCGARHGYMPIAVEVVPPAQFAAWVASKGGTMPGAKPPRRRQHRASPVSRRGRCRGRRARSRRTRRPANPAVKQPATNQAATAQN